MVTTRDCSKERSSAWPSLISAAPEVSSICVNALMSAPAQNSIGLAEAMTSAPISGCDSTCAQMRPSSWITCGEMEFAGGRSSHAIAVSPRVSSFTASPCSKPSSGRA